MNWAVVYTHPRQEKRAMENLTRQGFHVWTPKIRVTKRRLNRFHDVEEALFPSYVFVQLATGQVWASINNTYGVKYLLTDGLLPQFLPDEFVADLHEHIKASEQNSGVLHQFTVGQFTIGDEVKITHGPFSGLVSKISDLLPGERVKLLFDILGKGTPAVLPVNSVVKNNP